MKDKLGLVEKFSKANTAEFPDFYSYKTPLEQGLWILLATKEKLKIQRLTAEEIAVLIRDVQEISIDARTLTNAFNRAGNKVHVYGKKFFTLMKPGREFLYAQIEKGSLKLLYFEPGKRYTCKKTVSLKILDGLKGVLKIVDPYPGGRTLDVLSRAKNKIKFLTRIDNLSKADKARFLRELTDYKAEYANIECRSHAGTDMHDRYIISSKCLVILGHSIKDLGGKESFALSLDAQINKNIVEALTENFDRRWRGASIL